MDQHSSPDIVGPVISVNAVALSSNEKTSMKYFQSFGSSIVGDNFREIIVTMTTPFQHSDQSKRNQNKNQKHSFQKISHLLEHELTET